MLFLVWLLSRRCFEASPSPLLPLRCVSSSFRPMILSPLTFLFPFFPLPLSSVSHFPLYHSLSISKPFHLSSRPLSLSLLGLNPSLQLSIYATLPLWNKLPNMDVSGCDFLACVWTKTKICYICTRVICHLDIVLLTLCKATHVDHTFVNFRSHVFVCEVDFDSCPF